MAAARVSLSWLGTRKTLTLEQKQEAAEPFGTDARFLSAGKRLVHIAHPAFKAVTAVRGRLAECQKTREYQDALPEGLEMVLKLSRQLERNTRLSQELARANGPT